MRYVTPTPTEVREIMDDRDHGIRHNGNDHAGDEALANCPRCAVEGLLMALDTLADNNRSTQLSVRLSPSSLIVDGEKLS